MNPKKFNIKEFDEPELNFITELISTDKIALTDIEIPDFLQQSPDIFRY